MDMVDPRISAMGVGMQRMIGLTSRETSLAHFHFEHFHPGKIL